jgi:cystathionine beta-lyase/cystathionine gamma-synthase
MEIKSDTRAVHTRKIKMTNEPLTLPIYQTSTFVFDTVDALEKYLDGDRTKFEYSRYENPTVSALQEKIAELEKGDRCFAFSSGMAAITSSLLAFLKSGDEVIASNSLYGRTQIFMQLWLPRFGVKVRLIPVEEFPAIDRYFSQDTKIVYIESPTNPTLRIIDIQATAAVAHKHSALLLIDSTFASPVNQNPLELGADLVLHSMTKYIAGHSDVIAGASIFRKEHELKIREAIRTFGGTMDPMAAYLIERGVKTMFVRVERQNQTAEFLARKCAQHPRIKRVNYPGLKDHPQREIVVRQMRGSGGMFSFDLENLESVRKFVSKLRLIAHAASLGGVETLVSIPVLASHHGQPEENLTAAGITQGTVRVSVGIENQDDLWADLSQALQD